MGSRNPSLRKQSSTNLPPNYTFFTDRDLGHAFPDYLRRSGLVVVRHDDVFGPLTPDTEWLSRVGGEGWVAVTHNKQIRYNNLEREMVSRANVSLFVLVGEAPSIALAENFVTTINLVWKFLKNNKPPFIAKVYRPSPVEEVGSKPGRVVRWL
jgi:hypothetical protein